MINSCVIDRNENGQTEVACLIKGTKEDFAVELESILRSVTKDKELVYVADIVLNKLLSEHSVLPDCFRPMSDSIEEFFNNILKGEETDD